MIKRANQNVICSTICENLTFNLYKIKTIIIKSKKAIFRVLDRFSLRNIIPKATAIKDARNHQL
jgi:hypothetical protein